eukprot:COSAG02_NODE_9194_length_2294_cov_3.903886_1_plen_210_part_10
MGAVGGGGRVGGCGWRVALGCCVLAVLVSGLAATGIQGAAGQQAPGARDSEPGASPTRWELRGMAASSARPELVGAEASHPRSRRTLSESNEGTTPCKDKLQNSPEADQCCKGLGDDEVACKKAKKICTWYKVNDKDGAHQEGGCAKYDPDQEGLSGSLIAFFCVMAVLAAIPLYKCCCTAKMAKQSAVSLEPLEPQLTASSQMYMASHN